ncbi:MAG TPA: MBL fold metallo-hydrolase, partial [Gemmatimonadales bacterium]
MIRLSFFGAAGQVTGSMHLLEAAGARTLLDAGLFQGPRKESAELNEQVPFDPRRIDAIVVSHAHIDHVGRLPLLTNRGFHGPIVVTPATRDLCAVMLPDSAHIQEKDFEYLVKRDKAAPESQPLYTMRDAVRTQELMVGVPYRRMHHVRKHLTIEYTDAGHILGSASVDVRISDPAPHRLVFSGDIGRSGLPIIR